MTKTNEITKQWTAVHTGACFIETVENVPVCLHIASEVPPLDTDAYHILRINEQGLSYAGRETVYARANKESKIVVTGVI